VDGVGTCVNNSCADLKCTATETCTPTPGGGAVCKDISCTTDADCPTTQWCSGNVCVDDICVPGTRTCVGDELHECLPNGGSAPTKFICGSKFVLFEPVRRSGAW